MSGTSDQFVVTVDGGPDAVFDQANTWNSTAGVKFASPNFYHQIVGQEIVPDDPFFSDQWHLNNTGQTGGTPGADGDLTNAWSIATGNNVVIAIVDGGVQLDHPDLEDNIFTNTGEIPNNNIDDDGNGWVDDVHGWDFLDNDNDPSPAGDNDNHGTAMAGVAAAVGNNGLGVTGVAFDAQILPVRISSGDGFASDAEIASAVYYAAGRTADGLGTWRGADVQNHSWGGGAAATVLTDALNWAATNGRGGKGSLVFASVGNDASAFEFIDAGSFTPGTYVFEWRYTKDFNDIFQFGDNLAWLADVHFPDGSVERFDTLGLPSGWSTSGNVGWSVVDDPVRTYGTGRYVARAGVIGNNEISSIRSKPITVTSSGDLTYQGWVSSETNFDFLSLFVSRNGGAFTDAGVEISGVTPIVQTVSYPASLPSVIAVGASTDFDYRADFSQYGVALDFVAPGGGGNQGILTTDRTGADGDSFSDYKLSTGTSASSAYAAGIGALLLSAHPLLTVSEARTALQNSADKIGGMTYTNGINFYYGYGRLNAEALLSAYPEIVVAGNGVVILDGDTTPSTSDNTDFGSKDVANGTATKIFTISNAGTPTLVLGTSPRVVISGPNAADFTVTVQPPNAVSANPVTFQITFNPSAAGLRTATVSINSNDDDESPYNFTIQGTGGASPEIEIKGNGLVIVDGDTTPSTADFTDFGNLDIDSAAIVKNYLLTNKGTGPLLLSGSPRAKITGPAASDFTVTLQPPASVAAGGNSGFQIAFNSSVVGVRVATVTISSNDSDEGTFTFNVRGTGTDGPEINVTGNALSIVDGDVTPSASDFTNFGSLDINAAALSRGFLISNSGVNALTLSGSPRVQISGPNASDFTVTVQPLASVAVGGTTGFQIAFNPSAAGQRTATVTISNNDTNENPYNFSLLGTGTIGPEIAVKGNNLVIADGDITPIATDFTDFGSVDVNTGPFSRSFLISNIGSAALSLSGSPRVQISGANASDFTVAVQPSASLGPGSTTGFQIAYDPTALGGSIATVTIANNDTDENPYNFTIKGTGVGPTEIDILGNGVSVADGDTSPSTLDFTDFGFLDINAGAITRTYTISNTGQGPLNLSGSPRVQISGAQAGDFAVTVLPDVSVVPTGSTTFQIAFNPSATGPRTATLSIASNDANENPYDFAVSGTGTAAPEIDVLGNQLSIVSGDATPSITDGTDFGAVDVTTGAVGHAINIKNTGSAALNLTGSPRVQFSGNNPGDFSVNVQPSATLAVGATTSFQIIFNPSALGARSAIVSIANDDSNENPYTFTVQGWGANVATDVGDTLATAVSTGLTSTGGTATGSNPIGNRSFGSRDVDIYSLQAAAGNVVTVQTTKPVNGTAMDTYLRLFNSAGLQLASNDDASAQTLYSRVANFSITTAGTYYVAVSGYGNSTYNPSVGGSGAAGSTGNYDLSIDLTAPQQLAALSSVTSRTLSSIDSTPRQSSTVSAAAAQKVGTGARGDSVETMIPSTKKSVYSTPAPLARSTTSTWAVDAAFASLGDELFQNVTLSRKRASRLG